MWTPRSARDFSKCCPSPSPRPSSCSRCGARSRTRRRRRRAGASGVAIEIHETASAPLSADPALLARVLGNLLENAIVHARSHRIVLSAAIDEAGETILSVADDGIGLPEAFLPPIASRST